jgi:lauroyl/myristoyl acyltransferase
MQGLVAWVLPVTLWRLIAQPFGRFNVATHPKRTASETAQIAALLGCTPASSRAHAIVVQKWTHQYEERFYYLRAWRPGGWVPSIDIEGTEHVSAALQRGHGIICWGGHFAFNNLVPLMAMRRLGLELTAFSINIHGISNTPFGIRYLNRVYRDIESRFVHERLMVAPKDFTGALRRMIHRLHTNGAVYFAVGDRGRRTAMPRFLQGRIVIATGPVAMAHMTGAALLPLYTFRAAPSRFQVTIGPPIEIPKDEDGNADYDAAIQAYADALTPFVLRDPGQWHGWHLTEKRRPWGVKKRSASGRSEIEASVADRGSVDV